MQRLIGDCNRLYRELPALHARDATADGFEWIQYDDARNAVCAWVRYDVRRASHAVVVCNYSGVRLDGYRIGVPQAGRIASCSTPTPACTAAETKATWAPYTPTG